MHKQDYLSKWRALPEGRRLLLYCFFCLAATLAVSGGSWAAQKSGAPIISAGIKLLVGLAALVLAGSQARIPLRNRPLLPWLIGAILVPPLIYLLFRLGTPTLQPAANQLLWMVLGVLLTAFWEEAVFRLWGRLLFEEEEQCYKVRVFLAIALIFGGMHLVNLMAADIRTVLLQVVFAALTGLFLQSLYTRSGSLLLLMLSHALMNASQELPGLWISASDRYLVRQGGLDLILTALFFAVCAAIMTRRGQIIKRGKPFLKLGKKK